MKKIKLIQLKNRNQISKLKVQLDKLTNHNKQSIMKTLLKASRLSNMNKMTLYSWMMSHQKAK